MKQPVVDIVTQSGKVRQAVAPLIISASRATDIPAFHAEWLMTRLREGYSLWVNPFNRLNRQYVSFSGTKVIVFWSKNPAPLLPYLKEIADMGLAFYFQFTLNNYEKEGFEPHLPALAERIRTFQALSEAVGKERVIWRFDPVCLGSGLSVEALADRIASVGDSIKGYTEKLVFSFVDIDNYAGVARRIAAHSADIRELGPEERARFAERLSGLQRTWGGGLSLTTCAEKTDLSGYGIGHNKCIDDALIRRICGSDPEISSFLDRKGEEQLSLLPGLVQKSSRAPLKDTGQRPQCGCIPSKDIGAYNTCSHQCVYCYASGNGIFP